jgi:hypothetical protein
VSAGVNRVCKAWRWELALAREAGLGWQNGVQAGYWARLRALISFRTVVDQCYQVGKAFIFGLIQLNSWFSFFLKNN